MTEKYKPSKYEYLSIDDVQTIQNIVYENSADLDAMVDELAKQFSVWLSEAI